MTALWFQAVLVCVFRDIWSGSRHSVACVIGIGAVTIRTGMPFQVGHRAVAALIVRDQVVRIVGRAQDARLIGRAARHEDVRVGSGLQLCCDCGHHSRVLVWVVSADIVTFIVDVPPSGSFPRWKRSIHRNVNLGTSEIICGLTATQFRLFVRDAFSKLLRAIAKSDLSTYDLCLMIHLMSYVCYLMSSILHLLMCLCFVMLMYLCFMISFSNSMCREIVLYH